MVTAFTNTAYACRNCGQPARLAATWPDVWEHYSRTSQCRALDVVTVTLPVPVPRGA